jgi:hypothetical protein
MESTRVGDLVALEGKQSAIWQTDALHYIVNYISGLPTFRKPKEEYF